MSNQQKSKEEVLQKLRSFCAYRERSAYEVEQKAKDLGAEEKDIEKMLGQLKQENFVDNVRFAELYARSKFRQNQWGKLKIRAALAEKRISAGLIDIAITELDPFEYEKVAANLINTLITKEKGADQIFQHMKSKGFEGDLIYSLLQQRKLV